MVRLLFGKSEDCWVSFHCYYCQVHFQSRVVIAPRVTTLDQIDLCKIYSLPLSCDSSTDTDINTRRAKLWTAIDRLSVIWKSDLTDKMKRSFFQAAVVSILLYGCTTWTLTKRMEKKLDVNYTRMLRGILNRSWRQHPTKQQLYAHLPPIMKTIQVRRSRHAGHCWRSRTSSKVMYCGPLHMDE